MKQKKILIIFLLSLCILSIFLIPLLGAKNSNNQSQPSSTDNSVAPPGTPNPTIPGGEINPETGIPKNLETIQGIGENLSNEDARTAYLKKEWQKILEKSETFGPIIKAIEKLDPVSVFLLGIPIAFSWLFFLTLIIWIFFIILIIRLVNLLEIEEAWIRGIISLIIIIIVTYYRQSKFIAAYVVNLISLLTGTWWMQFIIIGIVIIAIILATYFTKQLKIVGKWIKEKHEKNIEELNKENFKNDVKIADDFRKILTK